MLVVIVPDVHSVGFKLRRRDGSVADIRWYVRELLAQSGEPVTDRPRPS